MNGFVLDGFPRTVRQAENLDRLLKCMGSSLSCCIYLSADTDAIFERLAKRAQIENRNDDHPAAIRERLKVFDCDVMPLVNYYRVRSRLVEISAIGGVKEVASHISKALGGLPIDIMRRNNNVFSH